MAAAPSLPQDRSKDVLTVDNQAQLETLLINQKLIDKATLGTHKTKASEQKQPLLAYLMQNKIIDSEALTKVVASANNIPYVRLLDTTISPDILKLIPRDVAERYVTVPMGVTDGCLAVAMLDGNNLQAVDFLSRKLDRPLTVYMASEEGIRHVIAQYGTDLNAGVTEVINTDTAEKEQAQAQLDAGKKDKKPDKLDRIVQDSPISRVLSSILDYAAGARASDVHIEPREEDVRIRARIDGILQQIMVLPKALEPALVSRVKILSNLKIDEHRIPQDGQFQIDVSGREIDLRIAISPVVWGEQIVIRLLEKNAGLLDLGHLGFFGSALQRIKDGIARPYGMILSSGPTGSGKSTTLYALINAIKSDEINIVTLEDPVEFKMSGVNQIQVNPDVGLSFASGLRSILRQDPNVIMVGEIRDKETANLAVQAALTGHLVFSTVHTNSAAGVLPRLLDMGVEPFLIASTVNTVIGQRLVRRLGDEKVEHKSTEAETLAIQEHLKGLLPKTAAEKTKLGAQLGYEILPLAGQSAYTLYEGKVTQANPKGYMGRIGIYEVFTVSDEIERLIVTEATSSKIQDQARREGMITMLQDGYLKALNGITSLEEVNRVASES
jgi:type IV pilus assembly protein PilB